MTHPGYYAKKVKNMKIKTAAILILASLLLASPLHAKNDKSKNKHDSLPPGLEKNYSQGKPLPPGWQKKLSTGDVLDKGIYIRGKIVIPIGKDGSVSIQVDGTIIKLFEESRKIISIG